MKRVVIVGAGFGGLRAARDLRGKGFDVLLLDRENYHLFQPLLYQVATASLGQESIAHPVRDIVRRWRGVRFRMAEVTGVDLDGRRVLTTDGPIPYDRLVLAAGAVTGFFGNDAVAAHAFELKTLPDAVELRNRVISAFERALVEDDPARRRALLTFVVVGGGPTGVEFAGALAELVRTVLVREYPAELIDAARILLVEMADRLLLAYPPHLAEYARRRLEALGVEIWLGTAVEGASEDVVRLDDGREIHSRTLLWFAGVEAAPLAATLPTEKARGGRVRVEPDLTLPGHPEVLVIGDMAYLEQDGEPLPQMAPVAMQMGSYAARHIAADGAVEPFRYRDRGTMAVIGRGAAVARVFGLKLRGFFAWLVWLGLHLATLIDFRNRLMVLINWAYDYLFFERKVRLITRRDALLTPTADAALDAVPEQDAEQAIV